LRVKERKQLGVWQKKVYIVAFAVINLQHHCSRAAEGLRWLHQRWRNLVQIISKMRVSARNGLSLNWSVPSLELR
jgi:hypothetical protein